MKCRAIFLAGCLVAGATAAETKPLAVGLQEPWSNLFAGEEAVFHATLDGEGFDGRMVWRFSVDDRTIARGERAIKTAAGARLEVEIRLAVPEVKPGVIMATKLAVSAVGNGSLLAAGSVERRILWVFPADPFVGRAEWLKKLDIRLFDPEGDTVRLFDQAGVPYTALRNVDALVEATDGLLVVGEGVSFRDCRGLWDNLLEAAAAGRHVLCLAPAGGELTLPVTGDPELPEPKSVTLRRRDIVTQLDKRLDAGGWKTEGKVVACGLKLRGERGPVAAEIVAQADAWPWMEMTFDNGEGRLVVCGFGIVGAWTESPTPRFLLGKILEYVSRGTIGE